MSKWQGRLKKRAQSWRNSSGSACKASGKRGWRSKRRAKDAAGEEGRRRNRELYVYVCSTCNLYHLTSQAR